MAMSALTQFDFNFGDEAADRQYRPQTYTPYLGDVVIPNDEPSLDVDGVGRAARFRSSYWVNNDGLDFQHYVLDTPAEKQKLVDLRVPSITTTLDWNAIVGDPLGVIIQGITRDPVTGLYYIGVIPRSNIPGGPYFIFEWNKVASTTTGRTTGDFQTNNVLAFGDGFVYFTGSDESGGFGAPRGRLMRVAAGAADWSNPAGSAVILDSVGLFQRMGPALEFSNTFVWYEKRTATIQVASIDPILLTITNGNFADPGGTFLFFNMEVPLGRAGTMISGQIGDQNRHVRLVTGRADGVFFPSSITPGAAGNDETEMLVSTFGSDTLRFIAAAFTANFGNVPIIGPNQTGLYVMSGATTPDTFASRHMVGIWIPQPGWLLGTA